MDPPAHTRLRRLVAKAFHPRRIEALRPRIEEIALNLLDGMETAGQPADLIAGLALPLPITVICELLGVPQEDVARFQGWTDVMLSEFDAGPPGGSFSRSRAPERLPRRTHRGQARHPLGRPADRADPCTGGGRPARRGRTARLWIHAAWGRLPRHYRRDRPLNPPPAAPTGAAAGLRQDRLLRTATDELLRYSQAGGGLGALRIATDEVELDGMLILPGDAVLPMINAANRDEAVFTNGDRLDLARAANPHLAFGHGIHYCLGAQLGRIELEIALSSMLARFPGVRLAVPEEQLRWTFGRAFRRPIELPVLW